MTFEEKKIKEFWLYWGEAPKGTPKYKAGKKFEQFLLTALKEQRGEVIKEITELGEYYVKFGESKAVEAINKALDIINQKDKLK